MTQPTEFSMPKGTSTGFMLCIYNSTRLTWMPFLSNTPAGLALRLLWYIHTFCYPKLWASLTGQTRTSLLLSRYQRTHISGSIAFSSWWLEGMGAVLACVWPLSGWRTAQNPSSKHCRRKLPDISFSFSHVNEWIHNLRYLARCSQEWWLVTHLAWHAIECYCDRHVKRINIPSQHWFSRLTVALELISNLEVLTNERT